MAIKETAASLSASKAQHIMPSITNIPAAAGFLTGTTPRVQSLQEWLEDFAKRRASMAEYRKVIRDLGEQPDADLIRTFGLGKDERGGGSAKRYLVDQETGVISIDEEEGVYTLRDAQIVSASIAKKGGDYDKTIALIKAVKGDHAGGVEGRKREWYVDDSGQITLDPENGEYTLAEAREVSRARLALILPRDDTAVTPDKLELMRRDMKDELKSIVSGELDKVRAIVSSGSRDNESPFTFDEKGELQINKGAKLGLMEMVVYNSLKNLQRQDRTYKDKDGTVMDLPSWLEVRTWERDQGRKDEMHKVVTGLIEMGRKEIPPLIEGIRNVATSKKAEEALAKGGWGGKVKAGSGDPELKTSDCAGCKGPITYTTVPVILACPKCHALNFIGTKGKEKEEFELITGQLAATSSVKGDNHADVPAETEPM